MKDPLKKEKEFLKSHQQELVEKYPGMFAVIKGEHLFGCFETYDDALEAASEEYGAGPFLVRSVHETEDADTLIVPVLAFGLL